MKKIIVLITTIGIILSTQVFAKSFSDLTSNHWAYKAVNQMSDKEIIAGYPDGTFQPEKNVTRAEFSKILVKALELKGESNFNFEDVSTDFWGYRDIRIAANYFDFYKMNEKNYFMPNDYATREDVAVAVVLAAGLGDAEGNYELLNKFSDQADMSMNSKNCIAIAVENGLMKGNADGTFNPKGKLTRAEAAQLILNTIAVKEKKEAGTGVEIPLDEMKYDSKTSTINLGKNWKEYVIGIEFNKKTGMYFANYRPGAQVITITEDMSNKYDVFTTDENGEKSYITIARKDDLENYVKIECEDIFKNVKYDSKKGYIDFGKDYSKYVYYISYTSRILDNGDTLTDTSPINFLNHLSAQKTLTDRKLSVYTKDLGAYAGPDCYVPFVVVGLKENTSAIKVIDTRADIEKYLKTDMKDITKKINNSIETVELKYNFKKEIEKIEIYIEKGTENELLTLNDGFELEQKGKSCTVKFTAIAGETYNVVLNVTYLKGLKEILTTSEQNIKVVKEGNEKVEVIKTKADKPSFDIDVIGSKIIVKDFNEFKKKYEYCYSNTLKGIEEKYQDFESKNDLIIKNEDTLYIRVKDCKEYYASEPFTVRKLTGIVLGVTDCKKSYNSNVKYREILVKNLNDSSVSYEETKICSFTGNEKYKSKVAKEATISDKNFDISVGDIVSIFKYDYDYIGIEEEGYSSYATLISKVVLEEKSKSEPMFYINYENEKVTSLSEVSVVVNKDIIPSNSYVSITVRDEGSIGRGISRRIDTITGPILLSEVIGDKEEEMVGKRFKVDITIGKESFSNEYFQREIKEIKWKYEK